MNQLTVPEVLFLEEHLRSCRSSNNFMRTATHMLADPQLRSFCEQMVREHQMSEAKFGQYLGISIQ